MTSNVWNSFGIFLPHWYYLMRRNFGVSIDLPNPEQFCGIYFGGSKEKFNSAGINFGGSGKKLYLAGINFGGFPK